MLMMRSALLLILAVVKAVDLIPLLECLASVTIAMGPSFLPYAGPVFKRCASIIHNSFLHYQAFQQNPDRDEPDKSFLVVALDLLSGLTQGLGMALEPFINNTSSSIIYVSHDSFLYYFTPNPHALRENAAVSIGHSASSPRCALWRRTNVKAVPTCALGNVQANYILLLPSTLYLLIYLLSFSSTSSSSLIVFLIYHRRPHPPPSSSPPSSLTTIIVDVFNAKNIVAHQEDQGETVEIGSAGRDLRSGEAGREKDSVEGWKIEMCSEKGPGMES
ncbi:hypothetical protein VNI00_014804, partial [Paramarasmius palmivorus]